MEVIEAMEAIILEGICEQNPPGVIAKDLLNLRYDCEACDGTGYKPHNLYPGLTMQCPKCNGTGKGSRMLAILAEDQEPPENPYSELPYMTGLTQWGICQRVQQDMLKTDENGYAFRRVKVQEDNNAR